MKPLKFSTAQKPCATAAGTLRRAALRPYSLPRASASSKLAASERKLRPGTAFPDLSDPQDCRPGPSACTTDCAAGLLAAPGGRKQAEHAALSRSHRMLLRPSGRSESPRTPVRLPIPCERSPGRLRARGLRGALARAEDFRHPGCRGGGRRQRPPPLSRNAPRRWMPSLPLPLSLSQKFLSLSLSHLLPLSLSHLLSLAGSLPLSLPPSASPC